MSSCGIKSHEHKTPLPPHPALYFRHVARVGVLGFIGDGSVFNPLHPRPFTRMGSCFISMTFPHTLSFHDDDPASPAVLALSVARAVGLPQRMRGLLFHPAPPEGCGLLIERCGSVHTLGMRYAIDVVFLDRERRVTRVCANVAPGRFCVFGGWRAASVLEVRAGWLPLHCLRVGMRGILR